MTDTSQTDRQAHCHRTLAVQRTRILRTWSLILPIEQREWPFAENGDDAHHLCAANRFAEATLIFPRQACHCTTLDLANIRDVTGEQRRVGTLVQRVDVELMEQVTQASRLCIEPEEMPRGTTSRGDSAIVGQMSGPDELVLLKPSQMQLVAGKGCIDALKARC